MSSPEKSAPCTASRTVRTAIIGAALALGLSGCLQPLYGPTASGTALPDAMAAIEVSLATPNPNLQFLGHQLRNELIFELNGSGREQDKRFDLQVAVRTNLRSPIVDTATGRAQAATIFGEATYTLVSRQNGRVVAQGRAANAATYERTIQRFATVRAARDAEIRLAKLLAEQIRTRVAIALRADPVAL